jgi:hypothetical protein
MISLALDSNGDIQLDNNSELVLLSNKDQLGQKISQRLKMFFAEWFLNTERGVPYFGNILGANSNEVLVDQLLTDEILKESEVTNVINVQSTFTGRHFTYSADVISIYGDQNFIFEG